MEEVLRFVLESIEARAAYVDSSMRFGYANEAFAARLGCDSTSIAGRDAAGPLCGSRAEEVFRAVQAALAGKEPVPSRLLIAGNSGAERWRLIPRRGPGGAVVGVVLEVTAPPSLAGKRPTEEIYMERKEGAGVLFVDDEPVILETARLMLGRAGFRIFCASDPFQALALGAENRAAIRAAVLDLSMPGMSGEECIIEMRRQGWAVPVIVMTGFDDPGLRERLDALGVSAFLQKPFRMKELVQELSRILLGRSAT